MVLLPSQPVKSKKSVLEREPEFVALVLAGRAGARLFPLTQEVEQQQSGTSDIVRSNNASNGITDDGPSIKAQVAAKLKHLLPIGGEPVLLRLLNTIQCSDIDHVVVAVAQHDNLTLQMLKDHYKSAAVSTTPLHHISLPLGASNNNNLGTLTSLNVAGVPTTAFGTNNKALKQQPFTISLVHLKAADCAGSADAVRYLSSLQTISTSSSGSKTDKKPLLPLTSTVLLMAADLVLEGKGIVGLLAEAHRRGAVIGSATNGTSAVSSITMLLSDVGEEDENGVPLKESAKQKKGSLARNEEDIEYIALSAYPKSQSSCVSASTGATTVLATDRVLFKRCKLDVEDDSNKTGQTPKLCLSKAMLINANSSVRIRTDLDDVHLYALSPWVIRLIQVRTELSSIQKEVIPLLTSRQFKGIQSAFGSNVHKMSEEKLDALKTCLPDLWQTVKSVSFSNTDCFSRTSSATSNPRAIGGVDESEHDDVYYEEEDTYLVGRGVIDDRREKDIRRYQPLMFHVAAVVLPRGQRLVLRACTMNYYSYACRELVSHSLTVPSKEELVCLSSNATSSNNLIPIPELTNIVSSPAAEEALYAALASTFTPLQGNISSKFSTLILPDVTIGEKVTIKSCTIGRFSNIGSKCRLNNVVIMDHAKIGDNCVLQNSVIGEGAIVGENCNFNDVQIGPGAVVRSGTKCKNESIAGEDRATPLDDSDDDSF